MTNVTWIAALNTIICSGLYTESIRENGINDILSWVKLGLSVLCAIITIISFIRNWYVKAKADGKITAEEVKELQEGINDIIANVKPKEENTTKEVKEETIEEVEEVKEIKNIKDLFNKGE